MLNLLISIGTIKIYIFLGLVILGLAVFVAYSMILERKINRNQHSQFRDRCNAEKTKFYD